MRQTSWIALAIVMAILAMAMFSRDLNTVVSLKKSGAASALRGELILAAGNNTTITQDGANSTFTIGHSAKITSGSATITSGNTTVDVTHNLGTTPDRLLVSPTADTAGKRWWVSAKGATTFTISIDSTHTADITFDWLAQEDY